MRLLCDPRVASSTKTQQHVVLGYNGGSRAREVECECGLVASEVVDGENEGSREVLFVAPEHPADARIHET